MKIIRLFFSFLIVGQFLLTYAYARQETPSPLIGIDEKLGEYIPLDLLFTDENGTVASLKDTIDMPTVLSLIYYDCRHICPALLSGISENLEAIELVPGKDFSVLTVSFDESDTPALALKTKSNYVNTLKRDILQSSWKFLSGDRENIRRLTEAAGFRFKREKEGFLHPSSLIILSAEGKIIRYLYGTSFLPRDLSMAVLEASEGRPGRSVGKLLLYCFSYDPVGKKYVFNILKVVGTATILFVLSFVVYLSVSNRAYRKERMDDART